MCILGWMEGAVFPFFLLNLRLLIAWVCAHVSLENSLDGWSSVHQQPISILARTRRPLSILFQRPVAIQVPVRIFVQGVAWIAPLVRNPLTPWDLNLVLSALQ